LGQVVQSPSKSSSSGSYTPPYTCIITVSYTHTKKTSRVRKCNRRVDVRSSGKIFRVATDVDRILGLIDANPVDAHRRGEGDVIQVDPAKVEGESKVGYDILVSIRGDGKCKLNIDDRRIFTIGSCGTGRALISTRGSAATPPAYIVQDFLPSLIHVM